MSARPATTTTMKEEDMTPSRYSIDKLLADGIQPFADLDADELAALGDGLAGQTVLAVPIVVTADGILIDGHQRLAALAARGQKTIGAESVRIIDAASAEDALEWAVTLNVKRRHLTVDQKAEVARRLQAERGWSQGKIAEAFGVSRPAVSQWLKYDQKTGRKVEGKDGRTYELDGEEEEAPKPKQVRPPATAGAAVKRETLKIRGEITNPELAGWISLHVNDDDRPELAMSWHAIAEAAAAIAEMLDAAAEEEPFSEE